MLNLLESGGVPLALLYSHRVLCVRIFLLPIDNAEAFRMFRLGTVACKWSACNGLQIMESKAWMLRALKNGR